MNSSLFNYEDQIKIKEGYRQNNNNIDKNQT